MPVPDRMPDLGLDLRPVPNPMPSLGLDLMPVPVRLPSLPELWLDQHNGDYQDHLFYDLLIRL